MKIDKLSQHQHVSLDSQERLLPAIAPAAMDKRSGSLLSQGLYPVTFQLSAGKKAFFHPTPEGTTLLTLDQIQELLNDPQRSQRIKGIFELLNLAHEGALSKKAAIEALRPMALEDPDPDVLSYALVAIIKLGDPKLSEEIYAQLSGEENVERRWATVAEVRRLGQKDTQNILEMASRDPDPVVRSVAFGGLKDLGKLPQCKVLHLEFQAKNGSEEAIQDLAGIGSLAAHKTLELLMTEAKDEGTSIAAAKAMIEAGQEEVVRLIGESLLQEREDDARRRGESILGLIAGKE